MAGVSDPCVRKVIRYNLRHPNKHFGNLQTFAQLKDCGEDFKEYFIIFLATTILLLLLLSCVSLLLYHKLR